jgi:hypothetical protein
MKKHSKIVTVTQMLLAPCQPNPFFAYPPYGSSAKKLVDWRRGEPALFEVELKSARDNEKQRIDEWVVQLIRMELGDALPADSLLRIDLPMDVVMVIAKALQRRAGNGSISGERGRPARSRSSCGSRRRRAPLQTRSKSVAGEFA